MPSLSAPSLSPSPRARRTGAFAALLLTAIGARADVALPSIFSAHAVLQRGAAVPLWGKAAPTEKVSVTIAGVTAATQANADGRWKVTLDLAAGAPGPHELVVKGSNRLVLARDYGRNLITSGPTFASATAEGASMRVRFQPATTTGGLVARPLPESYRPRSTLPRTVPLPRHSPGGEVEGFANCGADRRWVWADSAAITNDTLVVSSRQVPAPVAVRYAWADNPACNLYNGAGLPGAPF